MTKLELNDKLADLYGINSKKSFWRLDPDVGKSFHTITLLIDDSARMFDLMIEHDIFLDFFWLNFGEVKPKYYTARQKGVFRSVDMIFLKDHETQQAAARFAIAMALVKLATPTTYKGREAEALLCMTQQRDDLLREIGRAHV